MCSEGYVKRDVRVARDDDCDVGECVVENVCVLCARRAMMWGVGASGGSGLRAAVRKVWRD